MREIEPPLWRRSTRCDTSACVEVARSGDRVLMRDSKDPGGPVLAFDGDVFRAFLRSAREGGLDRP